MDAAGNIYFADQASHSIRKISAAGIISTIAGSGAQRDVNDDTEEGDGSNPLAIQLNSPTGVAVDGAGNVYFTDTGNQRVRKINASGGMVILAGTGTAGFTGDGNAGPTARINNPTGIAVDAAGNVYFSDTGNQRIRRIATNGVISTVVGSGTTGSSGDGEAATSATLSSPSGLAVDAAGNLYICDTINQRVRKVTSDGKINAFAGVDAGGYSGDGNFANVANLSGPAGISVGPDGTVYIVDAGNIRVRKVTTEGKIFTIAGNGIAGYTGDNVPATSTRLKTPVGAVADAAGNVYITDSGNNRIRKVIPDGVITTFAGTGTSGFRGDGGQAAAAQLNGPAAVAVDSAGNVFIADAKNDRVRKVTPAGVISTVVGSGLFGFSGDGGPAASAQIYNPIYLAFDASGRLFLSDYGNQRVRVVGTDGVISTFAGTGEQGSSGTSGAATSMRLNNPLGLAIDSAGNVFIADSGNHRVRKVTPGGDLTTVAGTGSADFSGDGGDAASAKLNLPSGVAVDAANNLYIADTNNQRIRVVSAAGTIRTVAGSGVAGYSGDGGPAENALLQYPRALMLGPGGSVYITDQYNHKIRKLSSPVTVSVVSEPAGLKLTINGAMYTSPASVAVDEGAALSVAIPAQEIGTGTRVAARPAQTFLATAGAQYKVTGQVQYLLSRVVTPTGAGALNASPDAADGYFNRGATVYLTPAPASGFLFVGFTGDSADGAVVVDAPKSVSASFTCAYTVSASSATVASAAGSGTFTLSTGTGCATDTSVSVNWLQATYDSGTVRYQFAANSTGAPREGTITVGCATFLIRQP